MESYGWCKGCKTYLTVSPGQPCSICHTISKPSKKASHNIVPRIFNYIDGFANRPSNNNYYNAPQPVQAPAYTGYNAPQVGYYSPPPLQVALPPTTMYGYGYDRPNPQMSYPLMNNNYYQQSPQVHEKKRAVLCGVTYKGHKKTLTASINNVRSMHQLLVKMGFPNASIHILTGSQSFFLSIFISLIQIRINPKNRKNLECLIDEQCQTVSCVIILKLNKLQKSPNHSNY